jgi:hypothetical protein
VASTVAATLREKNMTEEEIDALDDDTMSALRNKFAEAAIIDDDVMDALRNSYPTAANFIDLAAKFLFDESGQEDSEQRRLWYEFEEEEFQDWLKEQPKPDGSRS